MSEELGLFVAVSEWLGSPYLAEAVERIAGFRGITSPADIDDLVQEVRIALWQKGLHQAVSAAWIGCVASNKVVDMIRRRSRRRRAARLLSEELAQIRRDPELECLLHVGVESLPSDLRRFFELRYLMALSERQLVKKLGISRANVRALSRSCERSLRRLRPPD